MDNVKGATEDDIKFGEKEVFVDFRNSEIGEVVFKVRNLILRNQEIERRVKPLDKEHFNILQIFIDTVSRNNFFRMYDKTKEFLKNYHYSQKKSTRVYEFHRLHSIAGFTIPNILASTYGADYTKLSSYVSLKRIESYAKDKGYITGFASDNCAFGEEEVARKFFTLEKTNNIRWPECTKIQ